MQPLNNHYLVEILEDEKKGSLLLLETEIKSVRRARIVAIPLEEELDLAIGNTVYIQQNYGHLLEAKNQMLIKSTYILAEDCG